MEENYNKKLVFEVAKRITNTDFVENTPLNGPTTIIDNKNIIVDSVRLKNNGDEQQIITRFANIINHDVMDKIIKLGKNKQPCYNIKDIFIEPAAYIWREAHWVGYDCSAEKFYVIVGKRFFDTFDNNLCNEIGVTLIHDFSEYHQTDKEIHWRYTYMFETRRYDLYFNPDMDENTICICSKMLKYDTNGLVFLPYTLCDYEKETDTYVCKYAITTIGEHPEERYLTIQMNNEDNEDSDIEK